ncbi:MAG: hypothetical protein C4527_27300 [Candidatus Omnitrophota bacterium]|nr:MAG: hypothetical protein C4527_27300 [Candidatus Omnitrophota bacterium]
MIVCVRADFVTRFHRPFHDFRIAFGQPGDEKERAFGVIFFEKVQAAFHAGVYRGREIRPGFDRDAFRTHEIVLDIDGESNGIVEMKRLEMNYFGMITLHDILFF